MLNAKTSMLAVLLSLVLGLSTWISGQEMKERVYIWDFDDRTGKNPKLTERITKAFEEALIQARCFQVLERRQFDKLLAQSRNEKAISDLNDISKKSLGEVKRITNAQIVILGEVDDDVDSGQFKITVSLQRFDSPKEAVESIKLLRGRINDSEIREQAMRDLVKKICDRYNTAQPPPSSESQADSTLRSSPNEIKADGVTYKISGWIDYYVGSSRQRKTIDMTITDFNFELPVSGDIADFSLTVKQYANGKLCGEGEMKPGHMNFPTPAPVDASGSPGPYFRGGSQVKEGNVIQVFLHPSKTCK
jgi:hypothetical protein